MTKRKRNRGEVLALVPHASDDDRARFWSKVRVSDGCWLWSGAPNAEGYGEWGYAAGTVLAHRVALIFSGTAIPDGMFVLHSCDTPMCCNPGHLRVGTHEENMTDQRRRGRNERASRTHCPAGHEYTEENTYLRPGTLPAFGSARDCRKCRYEHNLKYLRKYRHATKHNSNEAVA